MHGGGAGRTAKVSACSHCGTKDRDYCKDSDR